MTKEKILIDQLNIDGELVTVELDKMKTVLRLIKKSLRKNTNLKSNQFEIQKTDEKNTMIKVHPFVDSFSDDEIMVLY